MSVSRLDNSIVAIVIWTWTYSGKVTVSEHVRACKWGVGAEARRVDVDASSRQLPLTLTPVIKLEGYSVGLRLRLDSLALV